MHSIFLYEHLTAGGCWSDGIEPAGSLLAEGTAMRDALALDLAEIAEIETIHLFHDDRLKVPLLPKQQLHWVSQSQRAHPHAIFEQLASANIPAIFIAPEYSANLYGHAARFRLYGGEVLSPPPAVIILCADKFHTRRHLMARGVPVPIGTVFETFPEDLPENIFPAVLKPIDGCGSLGVQMIESVEELRAFDLSYEVAVDLHTNPMWVLEKFHPGLPVSVSVLTGPRGVIPLQPCTQRLSDDGRFQYLGGSTPIAPHLAQRAQRLAQKAAETLLPCHGYVGIDMVLGSAENGAGDVVIEINPRLTTSYLGLRLACEQNLAEAMVKWGVGEPVSLTWRDEPIEFGV